MAEARGVTELTIGSLSDIGISRDHQGDSVGYANMFEKLEYWPLARRKGNIYVVADGVGGRAAGEVASRLAVNAMLDGFYRDPSTDIRTSLLEVIREVNSYVVQENQSRETSQGMRTTIVCTVIRGQELWTIHAGDSRAYLVRNGRPSRITEDHSLPNSHIITQSLGNPAGVEPSVRWEEIRTGDIIVLCSDGLHNVVSDEQIAQTVAYHEPQAACEMLVDMANQAGGEDNITVIVIRVSHVVPEPHPEWAPQVPLPPGFGVRPKLRNTV